MSNFFWIVLAFLLVLLNAFFVAAEFGMVKLRSTRVEAIKNTYGFRGKILHQVHQQLDAYLSACQLGITFASLGLGWIGEPAFARLIEPIFTLVGVDSPQVTTLIAFVVAFSVISFLHIVVGELMPKSLAIRQSEKISLWTAVPLYGFYWLMYPAIWLLNNCSNFLLRAFKLNATHRSENFYSTEEIKLLLNASHLHGELSEEEADIMEHALDLADLKVTEVMRSSDEMIMLNKNSSWEEMMALIVEHRYSRYPVYETNKKNIVGIIHIKDILPLMHTKNESHSLHALIRPVVKVSRQVRVMDLLRQFREGAPHFALVYRGKSTLLGFVTLDNLLQVLLGRIKDEFHRTKQDWKWNKDGSISASGNCSIYALEQALELDIDVEEHIDVLNGLFIQRLGYVPKEGEWVYFPEFNALVEKVKGSKILKMKIYTKDWVIK